MNSYKNSKARLFLILLQTLAICYTIFREGADEDAQILAVLLLPMSYMAFKSWRDK
jgi:hypothetical protein